MKVVHLGHTHRSDDVRIYLKECASLARAGYEVTYITSKTPDARFLTDLPVRVIELDLGREGFSRLRHPIRHYRNQKRVQTLLYDTALAEQGEIYHVHEYNLLPVALRLKNETGAKIIYDIHEDVPRQQADRYANAPFWLSCLKRIEFSFLERWENKLAKQCDYLITATEAIAKRFCTFHEHVVCVYNYPILREQTIFPSFTGNHICYVGMITEQRGILTLVDSLHGTDAVLDLVGDIAPSLLEKLQVSPGWGQVEWHGYLSRSEADQIRQKALAGIVTFLPYQNHINALPNKIFEYMEAGLPIIASDFPIWKTIVEENHCGICVDPSDSRALRNAIQYCVNHVSKAEDLGQNGRKAVCKRYHWGISERVLFSVYHTLCISLSEEKEEYETFD